MQCSTPNPGSAHSNSQMTGAVPAQPSTTSPAQENKVILHLKWIDVKCFSNCQCEPSVWRWLPCLQLTYSNFCRFLLETSLQSTQFPKPAGQSRNVICRNVRNLSVSTHNAGLMLIEIAGLLWNQACAVVCFEFGLLFVISGQVGLNILE